LGAFNFKFIGHLDLEAALGRKSLGSASIAAWRKFWLDLQDFVAIMHRRYVDARGTFYLNGVGNISDAELLLKAVKESTYFHAALKDRAFTGRVGEIAFNSKYYNA
jgi:hypothetical protein